VIAIALFNIFGDNGSPSDQQVGRSSGGQNDALQRQDYARLPYLTCRDQQGIQAECACLGNGIRWDRRGQRFVDDVTDVVIDGDRGKRQVTYHFRQHRMSKPVFDDVPCVRTRAWRSVRPAPTSCGTFRP